MFLLLLSSTWTKRWFRNTIILVGDRSIWQVVFKNWWLWLVVDLCCNIAKWRSISSGSLNYICGSLHNSLRDSWSCKLPHHFPRCYQTTKTFLMSKSISWTNTSSASYSTKWLSFFFRFYWCRELILYYLKKTDAVGEWTFASGCCSYLYLPIIASENKKII